MGEARGKRLSESELFAAIFFELSEALGDQVSSERLIEAANHLVRLIDDDFGIHRLDRIPFRTNYYSQETDQAITMRGWQILCKECALDYLEGETIDPTFLRRRLLDLGVSYD